MPPSRSNESNPPCLKAVIDDTTRVNQYRRPEQAAGVICVIRLPQRGTQYGYSIFELEAHGSLYAGIACQWTAGIYPNPVSGSELRISSSDALRQVKVNRHERQNMAETVYPRKERYPAATRWISAGYCLQAYLLQLWNKGMRAGR